MTAENIINNLKFTAAEADEQTDLFTPEHTLFKCKITNKNNKKQFSFNYQCNTKNQQPNIEDCLYCLLLDVNCYESAINIDDFIQEFGYNDNLQRIRQGEKAYKACKRTAKAIERLFNNDEIETLNKHFENY